MNRILKNKEFKKSAALVLLSILSIAGFAQDGATTVASPSTSTDNAMMYVLVGTSAVLLLGILLLGSVMLKLAKLVMEKEKGKLLLALLVMFGSGLFAQDPATAPANVGFAVNWDMVAAVAVLSIELITIVYMLYLINKLAASLSDKPEEEKSVEFHLPKLFDNLNASVAVEREADILLDHNYDGIKELDNNLPPWWKYGFYLTIVWSVGYLFYYHVYGAPLSEEEFNTEMQQAKVEVDEYMKKSANNVDESNVKLADAAGIKEGLEVYKNNCAACHGNSGEGGVGPNMTDAYWIHGGGIADVFKSIKYGWPAKGMKSWQSDLSPVQMKNVASYILSLQGSNPANAKAAEGDLYQPAAATVASDSATAAK